MSRVPDLVRDSKLDTRFHSKYLRHRFLESGTTPQQRAVVREEYWKREKHVGRGSYGSVWLERCIKGEQGHSLRAVKEIPRAARSNDKIDYNRELEAIAKFSHEKYVRCFVRSFGWYENDSTLFIAMEYFDEGDLHDYLNNSPPMPEAEARQVAYQLAEGLAYLHENGFAHRDLKPSNILVNSKPPEPWWVKIGDFGISKRVEDGMTVASTLKGTLRYMSPELHGFVEAGKCFKNDPQAASLAADVWSLGEIVFEMLTQQSTFNNFGLLSRYVQQPQLFPISPLQEQKVTDTGIDFIQCLIQPFPIHRATIGQALLHVWMECCRVPSPRPASLISIESSTSSNASTNHKSPLGPEASGRWSTVSMNQGGIIRSSNNKALDCATSGSSYSKTEHDDHDHTLTMTSTVSNLLARSNQDSVDYSNSRYAPSAESTLQHGSSSAGFLSLTTDQAGHVDQSRMQDDKVLTKQQVSKKSIVSLKSTQNDLIPTQKVNLTVNQPKSDNFWLPDRLTMSQLPSPTEVDRIAFRHEQYTSTGPSSLDIPNRDDDGRINRGVEALNDVASTEIIGIDEGTQMEVDGETFDSQLFTPPESSSRDAVKPLTVGGLPYHSLSSTLQELAAEQDVAKDNSDSLHYLKRRPLPPRTAQKGSFAVELRHPDEFLRLQTTSTCLTGEQSGEFTSCRYTAVACHSTPIRQKTSVRILQPTQQTLRVTTPEIVHDDQVFLASMTLSNMAEKTETGQTRWCLLRVLCTIKESFEIKSSIPEDDREKILQMKDKQYAKSKIISRWIIGTGLKTDPDMLGAEISCDISWAGIPEVADVVIRNADIPFGTDIKHNLLVELLVAKEFVTNDSLRGTISQDTRHVLRSEIPLTYCSSGLKEYTLRPRLFEPERDIKLMLALTCNLFRSTRVSAWVDFFKFFDATLLAMKQFNRRKQEVTDWKSTVLVIVSDGLPGRLMEKLRRLGLILAREYLDSRGNHAVKNSGYADYTKWEYRPSGVESPVEAGNAPTRARIYEYTVPSDLDCYATPLQVIACAVDTSFGPSVGANTWREIASHWIRSIQRHLHNPPCFRCDIDKRVPPSTDPNLMAQTWVMHIDGVAKGLKATKGTPIFGRLNIGQKQTWALY